MSVYSNVFYEQVKGQLFINVKKSNTKNYY